MHSVLMSLARQVIGGTRLSRPQAEWIAGLEPACLPDLFRVAAMIRDHFRPGPPTCCSIVAAKVGACAEDCAFCSQSGHYKTPVQGRSLLSPQQVLEAATAAADGGADAFGIVNSGYAPSEAEIEQWGPVLRTIADAGRVRACASLGVLTPAKARRLKAFGVARSNHNLQTSRRFFPRIVSTHSYDDRLATLHHLKEAGIGLCSGGLFGMGESWADRLDLAFELRELEPEVVPLNFLIPIAGTPLERAQPLTALECLKIIAVFRFLLPRASLKIAGGREAHLRDLQSWMFLAGADSFMLGNYLTTCGRDPRLDQQMLSDLGYTRDPVEA